jgi:hypothetical protein
MRRTEDFFWVDANTAESYLTGAALGSLVAGLRDLATIERADALSYEVVLDPGCTRDHLRPYGDARRPAELLVLSLRRKVAAPSSVAAGASS